MNLWGQVNCPILEGNSTQEYFTPYHYSYVDQIWKAFQRLFQMKFDTILQKRDNIMLLDFKKMVAYEEFEKNYQDEKELYNIAECILKKMEVFKELAK